MEKTLWCHGKPFVPHIRYETINQRCIELGNVLHAHYRNQCPIFLVVLNGAFMFASELLRQYQGNCEVSFVKLASYSGTSSTGKIKELIGLNESLKGRDVIVVEDIVDTGHTMAQILRQLDAMGVASVEIATLLFKPKALVEPIQPRYVGFEAENLFYLGFGLDYDGLGRNWPHIYKLAEGEMEAESSLNN